MAKSFPIDIGVTAEDTSGKIPTLIKQPEQVYRTVLTSTNVAFQWDMAGYNMFSIALNNGGISGQTTFIIQSSNNGKDWAYTPVESTSAFQSVPPNLPLIFTMSNLGTVIFTGPRSGRFMRILMNALPVNHTAIITLSMNQFISRKSDPNSYPDALWYYNAPTGGISTTSPTTVKALSSPAYRMAVSSMQLINTGSAGTEYTIQDNSATPVVLYRGYISANSSQNIRFEVPLRGSGGKQIDFVLNSATNVTVYPNFQGFVTNY